MGQSVSNFANMFVELSQIQFAASQAEALGKGTASASGLPFPYNLAAIGTVVSTIMATFASFKGIGKFADGGIISGPTLGLMGEYSGAANNPEVVAPLDKLRTLIGDNCTSNSNVRFEIEGRTLVGILGKENRLNSRR